jgi:hypothetical protein
MVPRLGDPRYTGESSAILPCDCAHEHVSMPHYLEGHLRVERAVSGSLLKHGLCCEPSACRSRCLYYHSLPDVMLQGVVVERLVMLGRRDDTAASKDSNPSNYLKPILGKFTTLRPDYPRRYCDWHECARTRVFRPQAVDGSHTGSSTLKRRLLPAPHRCDAHCSGRTIIKTMPANETGGYLAVLPSIGRCLWGRS